MNLRMRGVKANAVREEQRRGEGEVCASLSNNIFFRIYKVEVESLDFLDRPRATLRFSWR